MALEPVLRVLEGRECRPYELIEILLDIQDECGHLSQDAIRLVSERLEVPLIEVFRVASFYKAFSLWPRGKHVITVCTGTACHVRGAPRLLDEVVGLLGIQPGQTTEDGLFSLEGVNCLGACALGPVVVLDGEYCHRMGPGKLRELIDSVRAAEREGVPAHA